MTNSYWVNYWAEHAQATTGDNPQSRVKRTLNKKPLDGDVFDRILADVIRKLRLKSDDTLLDLCCGNGVVTTALSTRCKSVVGVDFTAELLKDIDISKYPNVKTIHADVTALDFPAQSFSKVLLCFAIQHFTQQQIINLASNVLRWLKPGGEFLITDAPDESRIWNFFNTPERERIYFNSLRDDQPVIGTWIHPDWIGKLGAYCGYKEVTIMSQPDDLPFSHYRHDIRLKAG